MISAIKTLETKLENLIAMVNKTSTPTPQPTRPGKLQWIQYKRLFLNYPFQINI